MSYDIILWLSFYVMKIFYYTALETHKGPPYIIFMRYQALKACCYFTGRPFQETFESRPPRAVKTT